MNNPLESPGSKGLGVPYYNADSIACDQVSLFDPFPPDVAYRPASIPNSWSVQMPQDQFYPPNDVQELHLQLYQELRNQVSWQDTFGATMEDYHASDGLSAGTGSVSGVPTLIPPPAPRLLLRNSPLGSLCERGPPPAQKPAPKKHTRMHIMARSRNGCWICRIKHLKCDELRPVCKNCTRFGIECDYSSQRPNYVLNKDLQRQKLDSITTKKRRLRPSYAGLKRED